MRVRLTLAYDGTDFQGWQVQGADARTVQGVLETALARFAGAPVAVAGAGRTDSGVHALAQVVTFDLPGAASPEDLVRALNGLLPLDVRALAAQACAADFHARRSATGKLYRYVLDTGPLRSPLRRRTAGYVAWVLDEAAVAAAAAIYPGRRDFASVANTGSSVRTTVRTLTHSEARFEDTPGVPGGRTLVYEVEADGFLRKMVRSLVGGLIAVGRGATTAPALHAALDAAHRPDWPAPAPACGLTLVTVRYPP